MSTKSQKSIIDEESKLFFKCRLFALDIKQFCWDQQISVTQCAERCDIGYSTLYRLINRTITPDVITFCKICIAIGKEQSKYLKQ